MALKIFARICNVAKSAKASFFSQSLDLGSTPTLVAHVVVSFDRMLYNYDQNFVIPLGRGYHIERSYHHKIKAA